MIRSRISGRTEPKPRAIALLVLSLATAACASHSRPNELPVRASIIGADQTAYHVVHDWPVLPEGTVLDEVSSVGVDSHGNVLVLQRGGRKWPDSDILDTALIAVPTVFVFDGRTGRLLAKWGEKLFALPHLLTVDDHDNVWIADVALHQVFKLSHDGRVLLTVGTRAVPAEDNSHFNRPSDVAIAPDGSFYVSDGYGNNRVVKFSPDGKFLFAWGKKGKGPGEFDLPHGIALDGSGRVYVVDRSNKRIQIFDGEGKYLAQWTGAPGGPPFASPQEIAIASDGTAFIADGGSDQLPDRSGVWVLRSDGSLIERFGRYGYYDGQFLDVHSVAVARNGDVYVADFTGRRVEKFVRRRSLRTF